MALDLHPFTGGTAAIVDAWNAAAPGDPITLDRFRDLVLLDVNFDPAGLVTAELDGEVVGAAYGVRRRHASHGAELEPGHGWIPFFFVAPQARGRGIGRRLLTEVMDWLRREGASEIHFSSYTPNYVLPGLDAARYPEAAALLESLGFSTRYEAVAMDRLLVDHEMPSSVAERVRTLRDQGYRIGPASVDDLPDLVALAATEFNPDWARAIRESVAGGLPLENVVVARDPSGVLQGWAMHGTYERVDERFGPFGVRPTSRGTGLGKVLLHVTLQHMKAVGAHSAWFLWTGEQSPAGHLYLSTGFDVTRRFQVMTATTTLL